MEENGQLTRIKMLNALCNIVVNIMEIPPKENIKATAIIQSQRYFNTNLNTLMLNLQDKTFDFHTQTCKV